MKKALAENRLGLMGHYYDGMYDIVTDLTQVAITFGSDVVHVEVDELTALRSSVEDAAADARVAELRKHFDVQADCPEEELLCAARTSVALDRFVERYDLQTLAYYYKGSGVRENEETIRSIIPGASMLTGQGIRVNCISPGLLNTQVWTDIQAAAPNAAVCAEYWNANIPIAPVIERAEIGELAAFLLSNRSACITGTNVFADGGMTSQLISREPYSSKNLAPELRV